MTYFNHIIYCSLSLWKQRGKKFFLASINLAASGNIRLNDLQYMDFKTN